MKISPLVKWRFYLLYAGICALALSGFLYFYLRYWYAHAPRHGYMNQIILALQVGELSAVSGIALSLFGRGWIRIVLVMTGIFEIWLWWPMGTFG